MLGIAYGIFTCETNSLLKTGEEQATATSCISNIPPTMDSVQHDFRMMNQSLTQTFREFY